MPKAADFFFLQIPPHLRVRPALPSCLVASKLHKKARIPALILSVRSPFTPHRSPGPALPPHQPLRVLRATAQSPLRLAGVPAPSRSIRLWNLPWTEPGLHSW